MSEWQGGGVRRDKDDVPRLGLNPCLSHAQRDSETVMVPLGTCTRHPSGIVPGQFIRPPKRATAIGTSGLANHDTRLQVDGQPIRTRGDHPMGSTCACTAPHLARIHLKAPREYVRGGRTTGDSHRGYCHATGNPHHLTYRHQARGQLGGASRIAQLNPPGPSDMHTYQLGPWMDQPAGKAPVGRMTRPDV